MSSEDQIRNTLRVVALATTDPVSRECCLNILEETESEVRSALAKTCWVEDLDRLREALTDNLEHGAIAVAKRSWNAKADEFNRWDELGQDEKDELVSAERKHRAHQKLSNC